MPLPTSRLMTDSQTGATTPVDTRDTSVKRERIRESVRNALWARTAGRCTICNRRLLGDQRTYLHSVLLAELAHNIGATGGDGSPRGKDNDGVNDTEAEALWLIVGGPEELELLPTAKTKPDLSLIYPENPKQLPKELAGVDWPPKS